MQRFDLFVFYRTCLFIFLTVYTALVMGGTVWHLAQLLRHYPDITIEKMKKGIPPGVTETQPHYFEALRKAGIPES